MAVEGDVEELGRSISLVITILITIVCIVGIAGGIMLIFYKTDKDTKNIKKERRILGGVIVGFSIVTIALVWIVDYFVRKSELAAGLEGVGGLMEII